MEATNSELILSIVQQIQKDIADIKRHLSRKVPAQEILDPSSYVLYVYNELIGGQDIVAQASLHVLPTSKMSGERKTTTDASYIYDYPLTANIMAIGSALNLVILQRPDNLIVRAADIKLVSLLNGGAWSLTEREQTKFNLLRADLRQLQYVGREGIKVKVEHFDPETDPHWNDIQTLIYTAKKEYNQDIALQKETVDAICIRDNQDNGRPSGETV